MRNLLLISIFLFFLFSLIETKKDKHKTKKPKHKKNKKSTKPKNNETINELNEEEENLEIDDKNNTKNESKKTKKEEDDDEATATPEGYYMSEKTFDKKLKEALEIRNLKPNKKITKDIIKKIFLEIYRKTDYDESDKVKKKGEQMSKIESDEKMLNDVFDNVGRGLDYDDKVKVSDLKNWIGPKRAQAGLNEIMDRMYDFL
jgi:hypothetical protein